MQVCFYIAPVESVLEPAMAKATLFGKHLNIVPGKYNYLLSISVSDLFRMTNDYISIYMF